MLRRREHVGKRGLRRKFACVTAVAFLTFAVPSYAALLPDGFFDRVPAPGQGQAAIEADYLSQNASGVVTATGQVDMAYQGYFATADKVIYDQATQDVTLVGNVVVRDPEGTEYASDRVEVTGNFKKAMLQSLVMVTTDRALITASRVDHDEDGVSSLQNGTYSPCGTCIDEKGRRIGWRVRTEKMVYDQDNELVDLEQPVLEILGYPFAWLPWVRLPDPSNPRASGFRMPGHAFTGDIGLKLEFPYFFAAGENTDVTLVPTLLSRQGVLLNATVDHRFSDWVQVSVTASGLYQLDRSAFSGAVGDREWRGAIQTSTRFTPTKNWVLGTSYSVLSDRAYLGDYVVATRGSETNEIYAEYLTPYSFADIRVQEFVVLGQATQVDQDQQAMALPRVRFEHLQDLGEETGQINVSGSFLYAKRLNDAGQTVNGVPYVTGYAGNKTHGKLEAAWTKQWVSAPGVLFTPYLGVRADYATYDGGSALIPGAQELFTATPIAAIDMRYPFYAVDGGSTHVIEPIAQLVYRGSDVTEVGITNDDAQSFVFDDTNLFSFNRFSGADRQETGLRANIGGRYSADFADGSYLDFVAGQSFHLAGTNGLGVSDGAQTGTSSGLGTTSSYVVAGVSGAINPHFKFGAKLQYDPANAKVARTALSVVAAHSGWSLGVDYAFTAADPLLGALDDQQDIRSALQVPLVEYWHANGTVSYDLTRGELLDHSVGLTYDDGFFAVTGSYQATGAEAFNPSTRSFNLSFKLKGPAGEQYGS